ncbi:uncharacterized protein Z520_08821 [Fonsecaea multimorphosa CBS 102226]|uniref:Uncharacterized protein n=1 Tax=Fonsecaea multimorphosa CBS 102226 TaxID=1442371 RepID=A0A0D2JXQ5_9EURO|nr:uncharacterized protein Z520_08821 [Fonsecaea multimorphosa CBS 102226]KIX95304.1 hypothetical protein Z520_08821 [Fonsecaea multimorphosa CBS 102226]OAL21103.1 hypothetical protein AYO22_08260 [Fonsecaea multimorphosa]
MADLPRHDQVDFEGSAARGAAHQGPDDLVERNSHDCPENDGSTLSLPAPRIAATHQVSSNKIFDCILFRRSKGIRDLAMQDVEKNQQDEPSAQSKARKEAAAQERKARREEEDRTRKQKRQESRERAKQNDKIKAERKAQEKRVQGYYGIRGYDPSAGMLRSNRERVALRTPDGHIQTSQSINKVLSLRPQASHTWGLEYGGPTEGRGSGRSLRCDGGGDITLNCDSLEE